MANLKALDKQFRLSPWNSQKHADYVAGQYGSMLATDPAKAEIYVKKYKEKQAEFEKAYEGQQEQLANAGKLLGQEPQKLPALSLIDWNPAKRFQAPKPVKDEAPSEAPKTPVAEPPKPVTKPKKPASK